MSTFIALLHSIVLTPERRVIMEDLRALAEELGYREPRTLVSTGNLVFEADDMRPHELEVHLEEGFEESSANMSISSCAATALDGACQHQSLQGRQR